MVAKMSAFGQQQSINAHALNRTH